MHGDYIDMRYRLFAVACVQEVLHLMDDPRSRNAVRVAHLYVYGEAADAELSAAGDAAADAVWAAGDAAEDAVWAARSARDAVWAAREVARDAVWVAREAARVRQVEWFEAVFSADMEG